MSTHPAPSITAYYAQASVRQRIREYCGATAGAPMTCHFLSAISSKTDAERGGTAAPRYPPDALDALLRAGTDIARSTWDTRHLLFHLDVDYVNVDYPGEPFLHPADAFLKLEPVYEATRHVLARFPIAVLPVMTGRGYHFTSRIPLGDPTIDRLAQLASETPAWLATLPDRQPSWVAAGLDERVARAHAGLGLVSEYLAHRIAHRATRRARIPTMFNGTIVGTGLTGRECVSIDLSAFGDPLDTRHIRVGFGSYQRHRARADIFGARVATRVAPLVAIPRGVESTWDVLLRDRDTATAASLARTMTGELPLAGDGFGRAIDAYASSPLAAVHRDFYARPPLTPAAWPAAFSSLDLDALPACVAAPLVTPNDLLLQPTYVQHVTRYFLSQGWHPRTIAGLVHSRYAMDCGWNGRWRCLDAQTRAEFDVRLFTGLAATGLDQATDFNCRSAQEKSLCPRRPCPFDLRAARVRLLESVIS